jgi:hypothetical protein
VTARDLARPRERSVELATLREADDGDPGHFCSSPVARWTERKLLEEPTMQTSSLSRARWSYVGTWLSALAAAAAVACSSSPSSHIGTTASAVTDPGSGWSGCPGTFDTKVSPTGAYYVTDFGCSSSPSYTDSGDNCCPNGVVAAAAAGLCQAGTTTAGCTDNVGTSSSIACERAVNWFSTGGSAFGLGARLKLTRVETGVSVVVFVIDNGPSCFVEENAGGFVLDISYPAIMALYGQEEGATDGATVNVTVVPSSTPLGIVEASASEPGSGTGGSSASSVGSGSGSAPSPASSCYSSTLGKTVAENTCVDTDAEGDGVQCDNGTWVNRADDPAPCAAVYPYSNAGHSSGGGTGCYSDTLGAMEPDNACVQSSNGSWYQCDDGSWTDRWTDPDACNGVYPL